MNMRSTLALVFSMSCFFVHVDAGSITRGSSSPSNTWGAKCNGYRCQNNAKCSPIEGICRCTPGWEGQYCNKTCDEGYYGKDCQNKCRCFNGASCDKPSGRCICSNGYQGNDCKATCPEGTFGFYCKENCTCPFNTVCSPVNEFCSCKKHKYNGTHCTCRPKNFSQKCSQLGICDSTTGACMCQEGYTGESCAKLHCGKKNYVLRCHGNCKCQYNATCHENDGSCDCLAGWTGSCSHPCPDGRHGNDCQSNCTCVNRKSCDPVTGKCACLPGWTGENCTTVCPDGRYGNNCQSKCECENSTSCDPVRGKCIIAEEDKPSPVFAVLAVVPFLILIGVIDICVKQTRIKTYHLSGKRTGLERQLE